MGNRRMISKRVIWSGKFLRMPISTQALYFHLAIQADDDGVVEAYQIMNTLGCKEDDLRVLASRGFVKVLNDDLVTYITDWREHNWIRQNRKVDSIYKDLLLQVVPDADLLESTKMTVDGRLSDGCLTVDGQLSDGCLPNDGISKDKISKDKISQVKPSQGKKSKDSVRFTPPTLEEVDQYIFENGYMVDAEQFVTYYASQKWKKANGRPLSDWQAAVRYWERSRKEKKQQSKAARELNGFYEMADEWAAERSGA